MDNEVVLYSSEVDEFMGVIQRTLLFQAEWESLLSAVPKSLVQMGSCFLAVYDTSNPAIAIGPAPDLLYTSLISNVQHVSESGVEAMNIAHRRMSKIYDLSEMSNILLDEMIRCIQSLPNPTRLQMLNTKLTAFLECASEANNCATGAHDAITKWRSMILKLRNAISDKQGALVSAPSLPSTPPTPLSPPSPLAMASHTHIHITPHDIIPSTLMPQPPILPDPGPDFRSTLLLLSAVDQIFAEVLAIDATLRRLYSLLTYDTGGITYSTVISMNNTKLYLTKTRKAWVQGGARLVTNRETDIAYKCSLFGAINYVSTCMENMIAGGIKVPDAKIALATILPLWGESDAIIKEGQRRGFIGATATNWDLTNWIGLDLFRRPALCSIHHVVCNPGPVVTPAPPPPPPPPPPVVPRPNPDISALVDCTDALGRLVRELGKVIRFFDAVPLQSVTAASVRVKNFELAVKAVIDRGPSGEMDGVYRADLIKNTRSVKAFNSVLRAVSFMYNQIHPNYIAEGLDLLNEVSLSTSVELRSRRQQSLQTYSLTLSTELADYMKQKKRSVLKEIRAQATVIAGVPLVQ